MLNINDIVEKYMENKKVDLPRAFLTVVYAYLVLNKISCEESKIFYEENVIKVRCNDDIITIGTYNYKNRLDNLIRDVEKLEEIISKNEIEYVMELIRDSRYPFSINKNL